MSSTPQGTRVGVDTFAGLRRELEVGLRIAPTLSTAASAAKALAAFLDTEPAVPVRLAGLGSDDTRVLFTLAIGMGTIDEIKVAGPSSRAAVLLIQRIIDALSSYDPAFVALPDPTSAEARLAAAATVELAGRGHEAPTAIRGLASIG
jgi:hypothetical protein